MSKADKRRALEEKLTEIFAACHDDPALFATAVLRAKLKGWQRRALNEIRGELDAGRRHVKVLARTCHGAGKTYLAAIIVLWYVSTRPGARCLTTAPSWASVANLLWPEIAELYNGSLLRAVGLGRMLDTAWEIRDTWYAVGAASDKPTNLEGHHSKTAALRVVDEAKAVEDDIFDSTAGMLDAPETLDLWISTPSIEAGKFWERDTKGGDGVVRAHVTVDDLINDPESSEEQRDAKAAWKAKCVADWGETSETYRARCLGEYLQNAEGALFPGAWLSRAAAATWAKEGEPLLGMDCAGSEDGDENAVAERTGPDAEGRLVVEVLDSWRERDTTVSVGRALRWVHEKKPTKIRVDVIGLGKGISDQLALSTRAEEYRSASAARERERFLNRKAEDAWAFRELLERGKLRLIGKPIFFEQLRGYRYEIGRDGRTRVVDPKPSPDHGDAALIACASGGPRKSAGFFEFIEEAAAAKERAEREARDAA